jgi:CRP-like cAMP-binding protein
MIKAGEVIDPGIDTYCITRGFVEVSRDDRTLAILQPGDVVKCSERVYRALTDVEIASLTYSDRLVTYQEATEEHLWEWIALAQQPAEKRFWYVLKMLTAATGSTRVTLTDLGRVCGIHRIWAGKILADLSHSGKIARKGRTIHILGDTACEQPSRKSRSLSSTST